MVEHLPEVAGEVEVLNRQHHILINFDGVQTPVGPDSHFALNRKRLALAQLDGRVVD